MKTYKFILLALSFFLFCSSSCENPKAQHFITIQNNSDKEIIINNGWFPIPRESNCLKSGARFEYEDLIRDRMIKPHSNKTFERDGWDEDMFCNTNDTLYIEVFYRTDVDRMSCEEFEKTFPLKKEWKVTLADMEACDWTLVYTP